MLEIEMKFPVDNFDALQQKLQRWNAVARPTIEEADLYFNAPDRDFGRTDEAFRLRSIGLANRVPLIRDVAMGQPVTWDDVRIDTEDATYKYRRAMEAAFPA